MLRRAERRNGTLVLDGEPLTCERIKLEVERAFGEHGAAAEEFVVSHGVQTAIGHEGGLGRSPRTTSSSSTCFRATASRRCFSDFTRTFAVGEVSDELREYHRLAKEALDLAVAAVKPGVKGSDIHRLVCDFFHEHGHKTQLHKEDGEVLEDGVHPRDRPRRRARGARAAGSRPGRERAARRRRRDRDRAGLYRQGFGGARVEDLLLVTDDGCEVLTSFPYELEL